LFIVDTDHLNGPGIALGQMCVLGQELLNKVTFDLDIWNDGSARHMWVLFKGHRSKFIVTGGKQAEQLWLWSNAAEKQT